MIKAEFVKVSYKPLVITLTDSEDHALFKRMLEFYMQSSLSSRTPQRYEDAQILKSFYESYFQ